MTRDDGSELLLVQVMLRSAQKLLGALRSDPHDDRERVRAAEVLRLSFAPIWSRVPFVELEITDGAVTCLGRAVLEAADDRQGLLSTLRQAEIDTITLVPGVEAAEIQQLLLAVHAARASQAGPDADLPTLLFRADLRLLTYTRSQDRAGSEPEAPGSTPIRTPPARAARARSADPQPDTVRETVREDAAQDERRRGIVRLEKYDSTLYFLEPREIEYLRSSIEKEYTQDVATNTLSLLLDTLELQQDPQVRDEVLAVLADLLPHLLSEGRFDAVAYLIGEARKVSLGAVGLADSHKEALDRLRAGVSEPRAVAQLFHALDDGGVRPTAESMGILLRELRPQAIRQILGWSDLLSSPEAKHAVTAALEAFFGEWPHALARMLSAEETDLVHAALDLAVRLKLEGFVDPVAEVARHPAAGVRAHAARALAAIGSASALRHLLTMADDREGSVRFEIWRTFAARPHRGALRTLEAAVSGKGVEEMGQREKRALFEAYGAVAGTEGVPTLQSILYGKSPAGIRPGAHTRACAAVGLGVVATPSACQVLEDVAAQDRDPVVRAAASGALREARSP